MAGGDQNLAIDTVYEWINQVMKQEGVFVHIYGKTEIKPFRKMGHITVVNRGLEKAIENALEVAKRVRVVS